MEEKISVDIEGTDEIVITISNMPVMKCSKQNLITASDYFKALLSSNSFKEGITGCVDFSLNNWKEEYYAFFCWLSSGVDLLKVVNTRCLVFFIVISNYFQLSSEFLEKLNNYASNIKILDPEVQSYLLPYWSHRFIPYKTMTTMILSNQSPQNYPNLLKMILAWLDEKSFKDRRDLESSEEFHLVRDFLKTLSSWLPSNLQELMNILEKYPHAAQVLDVVLLLSNIKASCYCTRFTPQILFKYSV
ncbi:hypothetical protein SteCoe_3804 [Stentor coeruleus]|uniref:BTB domain-containing protein n=1 Tax=Stentor coeruleus TaxID=5963 RepID=A0A1R2CW46_9CILI|nr:hypothetical protein SteCoe_3804 [Stentor coeruleus]